jgi:NADP-dependent 3-hydroxy acid dehydrogenase YdfG
MTTLQGQRAWVTGVGSGISLATARLLVSAGAEVVLSARREDRIAGLAEELRAQTPARAPGN